ERAKRNAPPRPEDGRKRLPQGGEPRRHEPEGRGQTERDGAEPSSDQREEEPGRFMVYAVVREGLAVPVIPFMPQPSIRAELEDPGTGRLAAAQGIGDSLFAHETHDRVNR